MKKYGGTRYNSRWDGSTTAMVGSIVIVCLWPVLLDDWVLPMVICSVMLVFVLLTLLGCYYRIDGDKLVVYSFFIPTDYPIDKMKISTTAIRTCNARNRKWFLRVKESVFIDKRSVQVNYAVGTCINFKKKIM